MKLIPALLGMCVLASPVAARAADDRNLAERSVFALRVEQAGDVRLGTSAVIGRDDRGPDTVLYFLTSSRLLSLPPGIRRTRAPRIQVQIDGERQIEIRPEDVFLPKSDLVEIAVFRATVPGEVNASVLPIVYDPLPVGSVFVVSGFDDQGGRISIAEHIRFESTRFASGDRDASGLRGCLGAPAIAPGGVFGVLSDCPPGRSPTIAVLSLARTFIQRIMPPQVTLTQRSGPQFEVVEREVHGPAVDVVCDTGTSREVDVPVQLQRSESLLGATATVLTPREVRVGDVAVVKLEDRTVRLRFTVGSNPQPQGPRAPCPPGQALITLRLRIAIVPEF